ncbi:DUF155-domain-containing protein [Auriscalpium vulgare]|uniref:DUF155-domain-containing protein n=1 Tax=Auriscalpium vulgare TaxID=40419 RepID=A0ACB8S781_9AGAM|nr:DUF155-domain-containing protein [Auriscalpium vulgare]
MSRPAPSSRTRTTRMPSDRPRLPPTRRASMSLPLSLSRSAGTASLSPNPAGTNGSSPHIPVIQRSSKNHQKLVMLPSDPQTRPLPEDDENMHGYETDARMGQRERKSPAERMSKEERRRAGSRRVTAYCVAEAFGMKQLVSFVKREHNVVPRAFGEALYAMYHLPLLPGYSANVNIRSAPAPAQQKHLSRMDEAEENGYQGTYFTSTSPRGNAYSERDGYISGPAGSPEDARLRRLHAEETEDEAERATEASVEDRDDSAGAVATPSEQDPTEAEDTEAEARPRKRSNLLSPPRAPRPVMNTDDSAEIVFFAYGVVVFFGFNEDQERSILDDIEGAGAVRRGRKEEDWEIEECHYAYDPTIAYPRIYNDFFTFKSPSHLLTLSLSHALAQSTLLAHYESLAHSLLASPRTLALPRTLARTGALALSRKEAMRLTGRLFRLRRDVVLGGNVLDVPEVFWEEASLRGLYEAGRAYFEIGERVAGLSERIGGASELLDAIHDTLNNNAMERITWIIIWLIVVACLVELGEIIARLVVHTTLKNEAAVAVASAATLTVQTAHGVVSLDRDEALRILSQVLSGEQPL